MRKTKGSVLGVFFFMAVGLMPEQALADVVITQLLAPDSTPRISGSTSQARQSFSPASTLKMVYALTAFEEGVATPATRELCEDKYLPLRPMRLNFQQAMYYSSNDFFHQVLKDVPVKSIGEMIKRCGFGRVEGELPESIADMKIYSRVRVTPLEVCAFLRKLAFGQLPAKASAQKDVVRVMEWPSEVDGATAFAKTGSWERTYWMVGLAVYPSEEEPVFEAIVVLLNQSGSSRKKAIAKFWDVVKAGMSRHNKS